MSYQMTYFHIKSFYTEGIYCVFICTGVKLGMRPVPMATACVLYHKFFQSASLQVYEPYLVAMSAIYLAGKVEEQHLRTRDIINVCHRYRISSVNCVITINNQLF